MTEAKESITAPRLPAQALGLVPHRGAMIFIDELSVHTHRYAEGMVMIRPDNIFVDRSGLLENVCLVELLAQLAAAGNGYEAMLTAGLVKSGFLAGVDDFVVMARARAGDSLTLKLSKTLEVQNVTVAEGGIYRREECLASGRLKLYVVEDPEAGGLAPSSDYKEESGEGATGRATETVREHMMANMRVVEASAETGRASGTFRTEKGFPGLGGHFPGRPLLPGIAMIGLAIALCESLICAPLQLVRVEKAKFLKPVLLGDTIRIDVEAACEQGDYRVSSRLTNGAGLVGKFAITLRKDGAET